MGKRTAEELIERLRRYERRRKLWVVLLSIGIVCAAGFLAVWLYFEWDMQSHLQLDGSGGDFESQVERLALFGPLSAYMAANAHCHAMIFAGILGVMIAVLINELLGYRRNGLLVEMWDRIKQLEGDANKEPPGVNFRE